MGTLILSLLCLATSIAWLYALVTTYRRIKSMRKDLTMLIQRFSVSMNSIKQDLKELTDESIPKDIN